MRHSKKKSEICIRCQKCCKSIGLYSSYPNYDKEAKEFYESRGAKVTTSLTGMLFIEFNLACPHLDSIKGCLIYDTRPEICKTFPADTSQIIESCELHKHGLI